jgi:hypothetical protein
MPARQQLTAGSEISLTLIREIDLPPGIVYPYLDITLPLAKRTTLTAFDTQSPPSVAGASRPVLDVLQSRITIMEVTFICKAVA